MDPLKGKYSHLRRLWHVWLSRKDIPFRKKFFIGYDLHGNTYWEFSVDGNLQRLRRKMEPYKPQLFKADYFSTIPPQWLQWLRRTRDDPPGLEDLINDQIRQQKIKILAAQADKKWKDEKARLDEKQKRSLESELRKVELEKEAFREASREYENNPWKSADEHSKHASKTIQTSQVKPRQ